MRPARAGGAAGLALLLAGCTATVQGTASPRVEVTLAGTEVASYAPGQQHVTTDVDYAETPPVGGPHDASWADCTGTVYDTELRPENAVHSLEHGAVWVAYDPGLATDADVEALTALVEGRPGTMLSPYPDLGVPVSLQAWNHQLQAGSGTDPAVEAFTTLLTFNPDTTPELGATCENPAFTP
ncbi:DUF3105 domain-containing protein [Modestobacter sp. Leaf380]|uniref:DUF3105 domain-containing protein n=1 Tax=Modestobacter sp. Leaf380 TaxID=1736356 RepID=UPI0009E7E9C6|nr:DUF3105 domain-containing protein [Modestobacter sp. Leaf380]